MRHLIYRYTALERIELGEAAAVAIVNEVERLAARRLFVVTNRSVSRSKKYAEILGALGDRCVGVFDGIEAHGPRACVIKAADAARACRPDLLLAIGGGSVVDATKLVSLCLRHGIADAAELDAYRGFSGSDAALGAGETSSWVRMIAVPTTLSAAEFTWFGGAYDPARRVKDPYAHPLMMPQAIILDPALTAETPLALFLATGMKAIDHAAEKLASLACDPLAEATSMQALRLLARGLRRVHDEPRDLDARLDCQLGMTLAMTGPFATGGGGASHAIGHVLGGHCGVPHGLTSCVLLPSVMRWNSSVNANRQRLISEALGRPEETAADALHELVTDLGLPHRLSEVGVHASDFSQIADKVLEDFAIRANPRPVAGPGDIVDLLELAQ